MEVRQSPPAPRAARRPGSGAQRGCPGPHNARRERVDNPTQIGNASEYDRGRENRLVSAPPPSEPDVRVSRIRLSSRWFYLREDWRAWAWAICKLNNPCLAKKALGQLM
jgi:hypothetical protein